MIHMPSSWWRWCSRPISPIPYSTCYSTCGIILNLLIMWSHRSCTCYWFYNSSWTCWIRNCYSRKWSCYRSSSIMSSYSWSISSCRYICMTKSWTRTHCRITSSITPINCYYYKSSNMTCCRSISYIKVCNRSSSWSSC